MTKHQWNQKHSPVSLGWLHSYKNLEKEKRRLEVTQKLLNSMWLTAVVPNHVPGGPPTLQILHLSLCLSHPFQVFEADDLNQVCLIKET